MTRCGRAVVSALLAFSVAFHTNAQVSRTTGALIGIVTDSKRAPLSGVTVTVTSPQLQGSRTAVTNPAGEYILPTLPPGTYTMQFTLAGLPNVVRDNVTVSLNRTTKINVILQMAAADTMTVTASQVVVDPTRTTLQTNFNPEHLRYGVVGSANRSYVDMLRQSPEANNGPTGIYGVNPMVAGANLAQNDYLIDGINTTNPVLHVYSSSLAYDAIQEISIQTLGKDAEYASSGGTVNVVTRSGGNQFSGAADWRFRDTRLMEQGRRVVPVAASIPYYGATAGRTQLAFDKNLQPTSDSQPQATLGGPVTQERLWFFLAVSRPRNVTTPPSLFSFRPGTRTFAAWNDLGKLTMTPLTNQTVTGRIVDSTVRTPNFQLSSFVTPEAGTIQTQRHQVTGLTYDAVLTAQWLATVEGGRTVVRDAYQPVRPSPSLAVFDFATGVLSENGNTYDRGDSFRDELLTNTTYYIERFGTHAVKIGADMNRSSWTDVNYYPGDLASVPGYDPSFCSPQYGLPASGVCTGIVQLNPGYSLAGKPVVRRLEVDPKNPPHTVSSWHYSYFAQDQWNPIVRLTVRGGIRYEQIDWNSRSVASPPVFRMWQPRFGVAYDVFNNSKSVVHAFGGTIMDDNQLTLPYYGVQQAFGFAIFDLNPVTGRYEFDSQQSLVLLSGEMYDPRLRPSYSNQYSLGFAQKVLRNTSVDVTAEYRSAKDIFEDYCGTLDRPLPACVITNQPGFDVGVHNAARASYRGVAARVESRPYEWLEILGSWVHARSMGSIGSNLTEAQTASSLFDFYPVHFHNTYGFLSDDARNRVKLNGYVQMPRGFTTGANFYWDDGKPWSVVQDASDTAITGVVLPYGSYYIEPRGSRRLPSYSQLDLQVEKDFALGPTRFGVIAAVYNVMNRETTIAVSQDAGERAVADPSTGRLYIDPNQQFGGYRLSPSFGRGTAFQPPRRYEFGARVEF